jgi:glycosyltransferase involved in cell wall biosynthesis
MFVTITIQTYNHAETLDQTLESLRKVHCPAKSDYEILIVDNNSTDNTAWVINKYCQLFWPRLRSIFESRQGLSYARNCALRHAKGQIACFLDDDVIVNEDWLEAVISAFEKYSPAVVGGRSYLIYPHNQKPLWLPVERESLLSRLDHGDQTLVDTDKDLFGLNFSVLKDVALDAGGFDTRLGRSGVSLNSGEEKDLLQRIRRMGKIAVYEPKAIVGHIVHPGRLKKRWFFRRIYAGAISTEHLLLAEGKKNALGKLFIQTLRCWGGIIKSLLSGCNVKTEEFFEKQYFAFYNLGRLVETFKYEFKSKSKAIKFRRIF